MLKTIIRVKVKIDKNISECWYDSDNYIVRIADGCLGVKSTLIQKNDLTKDDKVQVTLHEKHNK